MTKEEAIKELTEWREQMKSHGVPEHGVKYTALGMAIEALQEQKQGKWLKREHIQVCEDGYESAICSECKAEITLESLYDNYCPNCGAKNVEYEL